MNTSIFLIGMLACSILTGLLTEAVKKLLKETKVKYSKNILAAIISVIVGVGVGVGYIVYTGILWTPQVISLLVLLIILSFICSMVGYDKVIQSIEQIINSKKK